MNRLSICLKMMAMGFVAIMMACQSERQVSSSLLTVVEQSDTILSNNVAKSDFAIFKVDVPKDGPFLLVDSVMAFLHRQLYEFFEKNVQLDGDMKMFTPEEMFVDNADHLLSHYKEKFQPVIKDNSRKSYTLELKLESQTPSYVTYGVRFFHCDSSSCVSEKDYYTFDKHDGHQVREIISHNNLARFLEDYPEYKTIWAKPWTGTQGWNFLPDNKFDNRCYGLLDDHFSLVIMGPASNYLLLDYPYGQIFSYLSSEAQDLLVQNKENESMLPAFLPERSEDGDAWMEIDTINNVLLGHIRVPGGDYADTLLNDEPELEIYPKCVYSIETSDLSTVYLFTYSRGHLFSCDEAMTCTLDQDNHLQPARLFSLGGEKNSVVSCMWYDQLVEASNGFPYDEMDENRFGIHYDRFTRRLYMPVMEHHEKGSGFENCLRYTGRFDVLSFNGKEFVPDGTDGAWWLRPEMRGYKRTVSNRITSDGFEQTDLMPDGTYRHAVWKGAKTLDDLRKKPDEVKVSKQ